MGYHLKTIKKGALGDSSKIREELEELEDAELQNNKILALVELADLYGAISEYLKKNHSSIKMSDLEKMSLATEKAFLDGDRK